MPTVIIVSLIDIFAILLIFVIVTNTFQKEQPAVVIKLPESRTASQTPTSDPPVVLTISDAEQIFLEAKQIPITELKLALLEVVALTPDRPIALNSHKDASFGLIIKVLDILKEAGVTSNVSAFTETEK